MKFQRGQQAPPAFCVRDFQSLCSFVPFLSRMEQLPIIKRMYRGLSAVLG